MASDVYRVERAVSLSLERLDVTVEVDNEVVPCAFPEPRTRSLYEERFDLCLGGGGRENNPALSLCGGESTLVRSLRTSSIFQESPG